MMRKTVLAKKVYDDRSHDERLQALRIAFAECKADAYASGKVNDCSGPKIAEKAKVDRGYMYTKVLSDKTVQAAYRKIGEDIKEWREQFQGKKGTSEENTALAIAQASINQLTKERDDAHEQAASYLIQTQGFKSKLSQMAVQQNDLINQQTYAVNATQQLNAPASVVKVDFSKAVVVSPDRHLFVNGKYSFHDKNVVDAAWRICKEELKKALSEAGKYRIYMLVGPPCSGKSHWVKEPDLYGGAFRPIIIDACNLTQMERHKWFRIIEQSKSDCKICAVYFDTPLSELFSRNNQRSPDKQMPDADIESKFKSLELINLNEEEYIDEIKVVRHGSH